MLFFSRFLSTLSFFSIFIVTLPGVHGEKNDESKTNSKCSKHESTVSETRSVFRNGGPSPISVFCPAVLVTYSSFSEIPLLELEREDGKWRAYTLVMTSSIS
ncbi:hypothetical protein CDAR_544461 [Caerostris darwini]|uniref:Secreted protein n=1 Tax=Caerostris darwini TaxID=1538125 RepID=A0AAV4TCJ1_9ARAC|nr:hypothetical protein CDAR_544461 [Caerostris darwini]